MGRAEAAGETVGVSPGDGVAGDPGISSAGAPEGKRGGEGAADVRAVVAGILAKAGAGDGDCVGAGWGSPDGECGFGAGEGGMKLPDLREAFLDGKTKLRRSSWESGRYIWAPPLPNVAVLDSSTGTKWISNLDDGDHEAEDWEVLEVV